VSRLQSAVGSMSETLKSVCGGNVLQSQSAAVQCVCVCVCDTGELHGAVRFVTLNITSGSPL
jgi:hypothetical protein